MKSDTQSKSLAELRSFRDSLSDARASLSRCCQLGRTPLGDSQYETEREYDNRIRAVSAEIARLEREEREAEEKIKRAKLEQDRKLLEEAADVVAELYSLNVSTLYRSFSKEENDRELARLSRIEEALRAKEEELEEELKNEQS